MLSTNSLDNTYIKLPCYNFLFYLQWSSINELNKLQSFQELQITHNPLLDSSTRETARQLIIAKIAKLQKCNRTEVGFTKVCENTNLASNFHNVLLPFSIL